MKKILPLIASLIMMLAMGMTVFAAPGDVISNNGEIICTEGSYNVTVFGKALSVAGVNETTIMPNNATAKMDVMVNGKTYKGVNRIVVLKDDNRDKIVLEKGSYILDATKLTTNQTNRAVRSLIGTVVAPSNMANIESVYMIGENGKVLDASGVAAATMLKTECNYISTNDNFATFAKEQEEAYRQTQPSQSTVSSGSSDKPAPGPTPPTEKSIRKAMLLPPDYVEAPFIQAIYAGMNFAYSDDGKVILTLSEGGMFPNCVYYGPAQAEGIIGVDFYDNSKNPENVQPIMADIMGPMEDTKELSDSDWEDNGDSTYTFKDDVSDKDNVTFLIAEGA